MIQGYTRKPAQFDWCDTKVWLRKLTKAECDEVFADGNEGRFVDIVIRALVNEQGQPQFTDRDAAIAYFDKEVAADDFIALGKLAMKHSGWDLDKVDVQKKS